MRKKINVKKHLFNLKNTILALFTFMLIIVTVYFSFVEGKMANFYPQVSKFLPLANITKVIAPATTTLRLLFTGDIMLDRHIDELTQKDNQKIIKEKINRNLYSYPFQGLDTLQKENYDAWIGNLECPVTEEQSTKFQKSEWLKFSCKKEYLPELAKYFDIVSLANNHMDNMGGESGLIETRKHLDEAGIKYFGHYDNGKSEEICKVVNIENKVETKNLRNPLISVIQVPVAFCGFHGVYKLPTDKELEIIKQYSDKYITIVMPHQGVEYVPKANTYQRKIYRKMIDNGADLVVGAHPHVIQDDEVYKGRHIYYSLGNFIFDQSWSKTREHMVLDLEIMIDSVKTNEVRLKSENAKPVFELRFTKIPTVAGLDFVTRKK